MTVRKASQLKKKKNLTMDGSVMQLLQSDLVCVVSQINDDMRKNLVPTEQQKIFCQTHSKTD